MTATEHATGESITSIDVSGGADQFNMLQGSSGADNLQGTDSDDIVVADVAGQQMSVQPGENYNIALIVDTSGSMAYSLGGKTSGVSYEDSRMNLVKDALLNLADQLKDHDGVVNVTLISFSTDASIKVSISDLTSANVDKLINAIGTGQGKA